MPGDAILKLKVQLYCGSEIAMGPGKADLLDGIAAHGSISAAARAMGMSYRRAWLLADAMNRCWQGPLIETSPGSAHGGGARLSALGCEVLAHYRSLQTAVDAAAQSADFSSLCAAILPQPQPPRHK
jgi:molybdate transport system regulatory protein